MNKEELIIKVKCLEDDVKAYNFTQHELQEENAELKAQIEKMKCCLNCRYKYCGGSSVSTDKNGNRTYHNWNKEKQEYCDTGKNGKYQCWELAE